jgi:protease YdgD
MNFNFGHRILLVSGVATVVGTIVCSHWSSIAAPTQQNDNAAQSNVLQSSDLKDISVSLSKESFLPSGLKQASQPTGKRGVGSLDGIDHRVPQLSRNLPWSTVGRIIFQASDGSYHGCTGTLIQEDLILTNTHCVLHDRKMARSIKFFPNMVDGKTPNDDVASVIGALIGTQLAGTDSEVAGNSQDWAILKLDKPLGKTYGYLGWKSLPSEILTQKKGEFAFVGYSGDFPTPKFIGFKAGKGNTASIQVGCSIVREEKNTLRHDCDTTGGSSGGPIIGWAEGKPYIFALNNAEEISRSDGKPTTNIAVKMSTIDEALQKHSQVSRRN